MRGAAHTYFSTNAIFNRLGSSCDPHNVPQHMDSEKSILCEWHRCTTSSSSHVEFGLCFSEAEAVHLSGGPYTSYHLDLCDRHTAQARLEYVHFSLSPLGVCSAKADPSEAA